MKNLKEYTPKSDTWGKILQQSEFENQLANHLDRLPQFSPNEESWEKITGAMDRKRILPIWIKWSVAASLFGSLIVAGLVLSKIDNDQETQSLSVQNTEIFPENSVSDSISIEPSRSIQAIDSKGNIPQNKVSPKIITKRTVENIEVPRISIPDLKPNISENLVLSLPEPQITEPSQQKTLHQVSISWSKIKPGLQVTTPFGRKELDPTTKTQAATIPPSHITVEINN
jgi:hypothetical protein